MFEIGYFALFISSFLSATLLPFSSEVLLSAMIVAHYDIYVSLIVATLGNWLGSIFTYWLGYCGNIDRINKWLKISNEKIERFHEKVKKYGSLFGFIVWVPFVGDVIAVCLGIARSPIITTSITIFIGKFFRYIVIIYITQKGIASIS